MPRHRIALLPRDACCQICQTVFRQTTSPVKFCSEACRTEQARRSAAKHAKLRKPPTSRTCGHCGFVFTPQYGDRRRKYCSKTCSQAVKVAAKNNPKYRASASKRELAKRAALKAAFLSGAYVLGSHPVEAICLNCKALFPVWRPDCRTFCSRECAYIHQKANATGRNGPSRARLPLPPKQCRICSELFVPANGNFRMCSDACRREEARRAQAKRGLTLKDATERPCRECSTAFAPQYGNKRREFCSHQCAKRHARRIGRAARRAKMRAVERERVDPLAVFSRDNWTCYLCGVPTPEHLRGTCEDNAPELDHIIPLSRHGPHIYLNTACCCRKCNGEKGDGPPALSEHDLAATLAWVLQPDTKPAACIDPMPGTTGVCPSHL